MKTKIFLSIIGLVTGTFAAFPATYKITSNNLSFSPSSITIQQGDTVIFNIGSSHNAVEVSKDTWDKNNSTSNGGFNLGFGGGELVFNTPGTFYYVCTPHASFGMKGVIMVSVATGNREILSNSGIHKELEAVYPNPFSDRLTIGFTIADPSTITIDLLDITGIKIQRLTNMRFDAGRYFGDYDLSYLKPGQYLILYNSNHGRIIEPLIKVE